MENYFLVYIINFSSDNGKLLASIADIKTPQKLLKGFKTKADMKRFIDEYKDAFHSFVMLKPII